LKIKEIENKEIERKGKPNRFFFHNFSFSLFFFFIILFFFIISIFFYLLISKIILEDRYLYVDDCLLLIGGLVYNGYISCLFALVLFFYSIGVINLCLK